MQNKSHYKCKIGFIQKTKLKQKIIISKLLNYFIKFYRTTFHNLILQFFQVLLHNFSN